MRKTTRTRCVSFIHNLTTIKEYKVLIEKSTRKSQLATLSSNGRSLKLRLQITHNQDATINCCWHSTASSFAKYTVHTDPCNQSNEWVTESYKAFPYSAKVKTELTWSTEWHLEQWSQARMHRQQPLCSHFSCLKDTAKEACAWECDRA